MPNCVRPAVSAFLVAVSALLAITQSTSLQAASTTMVIYEFRARGPNGGCSHDALRGTGGAGLFYCFAAN